MNLKDESNSVSERGTTVAAVCRLRVLGHAELWTSTRGDSESTTVGTDTELAFGSGKPLALVTYLASAPRRRASREHLLGVLWSDRTAEEARHVLRQTIWAVRRRLGERMLRTSGDDVELSLEIASDRDEFLGAIEAGDLNKALDAYRGDFLPNFASPGAAEFERWCEVERARLRDLFVRAGEACARQLMATGQPRPAVLIARRCRDARPQEQGTWRLLLEALIASGDLVGAAGEADALERLVDEEQEELEPASKSVIRVARKPLSSAADSSFESVHRTLDLVGREREFSAILGAWERVRQRGTPWFVDVTSSPGMGKTRLLQDVSLRLRAARARHVLVRAHSGQRAVSFSYLADLVSALAALPGAAGVSSATAASLVALNPTLTSTYVGAPGENASPSDVVRRRILAVRELVLSTCDEAPLAVLIDDAHWMDPASRLVLAASLEGIHDARLLVVVTSRVGSPQLIATTNQAHRLEPLSTQDIESMLSGFGDLPNNAWVASLCGALHATTGGVPLLVVDVMQFLAERGLLVREGVAWSAPQPDALMAALTSRGVAGKPRVALASGVARVLLLHLAVAAGPMRASQLMSACELDEERFAIALGELDRLGLAVREHDMIELGHDTFADSLLAEASHSEVRGAHRALAKAISTEGSVGLYSLLRAAQHLASAGADAELVLVLIRAAREARRSGDHRDLGAIVRDVFPSTDEPERAARVEKAVRRTLGRTRTYLALALVGVIASLATWSTFRSEAPARRAPDASLLVIYDAPLATFAATIDLRRDMFTRAESESTVPSERYIDVRAKGRQTTEPVTSSLMYDTQVEQRPDRKGWAFALRGNLTDRIGLTVPSADGADQSVYLHRYPGELGRPSWSPDGDALVFSRERLDAPLSELVVAERSSHRTRTLQLATLSMRSARTPIWSPDGTRIAFVRATSDSLPGDLCWTSVDAKEISCGRVTGTVDRVHAWRDARRLVVEIVSEEAHSLLAVDVDSLGEEVLERNVRDVVVSRDGRWILTPCSGPRCPNGWAVAPMGMLAAAKPLIVPKLRGLALLRWKRDSAIVARTNGENPFQYQGRLMPHWMAPQPTPPYVAALRVMWNVTGNREYVGRALDQYGRPIISRLLRMKLLDSTDARLTDDGTVQWTKRDGVVRLLWSAGGWRADTVVVVSPPGPDTSASRREQRKSLRDAYRRWEAK